VVVLSFAMGMHFQDLYSQIRVKSRILLLQQILTVAGAALLVQGVIGYLSPSLGAPLQIMLLGCPAAMVVIFLWRVFYSAWAMPAIAQDRLILVGDSPLLEELGKHVSAHPELGLEVAGHVRAPSPRQPGEVSPLRSIIEAAHARRIVVGMRDAGGMVPIEDLLEMRFAGYEVEAAETAYEKILGRTPLEAVRPSQLVSSGELRPRPQSVFYQRVFHMAVAAAGIVVTAPLMALAALAVRLSRSGGVLARQVRVGLDGALFTRYKFRTMNAEAEAAGGAAWVSGDDPRLTPAGRLLRRLRIDELPQLFSVLKGDMALVGPHPERPEFVEALSQRLPCYRQRHTVRPGITGWAQFHYHPSEEPEDSAVALEYDLYYVKNASVALDVLMLFHTVKFIVLSRGGQ
jgi:exopolysaccharide biosynthesis polyprenyl glycosylphosphotransferase